MIVIVIASMGCASSKPAPQTVPRSPDWFHLCTNPRTQSMCTPASQTEMHRPIRVDTNLTSPAQRSFG